MNKFFKIFFITIIGLSIIKCSNSDSTTTITLNDYTEQKNTDEAKIVKYLKEHHITVDPITFDVTFKKVPLLDPSSIWGTNDAVPNADVLIKTCKSNNVDYKIYYMNFRQGINSTNKPCNLDGVWTAFKGRLMDEYDSSVTPATGGTSDADIGTVFDSNDNPTSFFDLDITIRGWAEIFPLFSTGNYIANGNGTISYSDFGAGVMFVPSGLAYFNGATGKIPSYSPLIFNFKLYEIRRNDHDGDGIKDFEEDLDRDGYIYTTSANGMKLKNGTTDKNIDDTDEDGYPDVYDGDDDGDNYLTKTEIKRPPAYKKDNLGNYILVNNNKVLEYDNNGVLVNTGYYSYNGTVDNLATPYINEALGVPRKFTVPIDPITNLPVLQTPISNTDYSDFTATNRLRNYLDKTAIPK